MNAIHVNRTSAINLINRRILRLTHSGTPHIFNGTMPFFSLAKEKAQSKSRSIQLYRMLCAIHVYPWMAAGSAYLFEMIPSPLYLLFSLGYSVSVRRRPFCFFQCWICKQISNAKWCFQFTLVFLATHNFDNDWRPKHVQQFYVVLSFTLTLVLSISVMVAATKKPNKVEQNI